MSAAAPSIARIIARELNVEDKQVAAAMDLIGEGATVPFIARYRKERTGGLDDTQLRHLAARLTYLTDLAARRETVLKSIREQDKLTPALEKRIYAAETKVALEDLYAPFKQKRRTKATIAREAGLAPLAEQLLANPNLNPAEIAAKFVTKTKGVASAAEALEGARHIVVESLAETPEIVGAVREKMWAEGKVRSSVAKGKAEEGAKFSDYFDFDQPIEQLPSHRLLALLRGEKEGVLKLNLDIPHVNDRPHPAVNVVMSKAGIARKGRAADAWLAETAEIAWKTRLAPACTNDLFARVKERADSEAIRVFSTNVKALLLAAPAGPKTVMGIDPGIRTGCKIAVEDATGKVLEKATV